MCRVPTRHKLKSGNRPRKVRRRAYDQRPMQVHPTACQGLRECGAADIDNSCHWSTDKRFLCLLCALLPGCWRCPCSCSRRVECLVTFVRQAGWEAEGRGAAGPCRPRTARSCTGSTRPIRSLQIGYWCESTCRIPDLLVLATHARGANIRARPGQTSAQLVKSCSKACFTLGVPIGTEVVRQLCLQARGALHSVYVLQTLLASNKSRPLFAVRGT